MKQMFYYITFFILLAVSCKNKQQTATATHEDVYTCPMHPQIVLNKPGDCPICGMPLVKKEQTASEINDVPLEALLKPTSQYVVSTIPVTTMQQDEEQSTIAALGAVQYDYRQSGTISSRIEGRIERLYVKYKYQYINKGDRTLDIYSPELMTSQENYLFVLKHDSQNSTLINNAKQRLLLLGMSASQIAQITRTGKPLYSVSVYSNYSGFVYDAGTMAASDLNTSMSSIRNTNTPEELAIKEGMYLTKGQPIFSVVNANKALVLLNIFASEQNRVKAGTPVKITPETAPGKSFSGKISFIEPFYREHSKTLTARVYFDNSALRIPIGSQVEASIFASGQNGYWLPESSVITLGLNQIVFKKEDAGFRAHKVMTGAKQNGKIQITVGLAPTDSVATNAQFLVGSESFIQVKE